ncbi:MAG: DUF6794 domain-containing protein [Saprospiraceae bacterium]
MYQYKLMSFTSTCLVFMLAFFTTHCFAQAKTEKQIQEEYNKRVALSRIDDVYIPTNTDDALIQLFKLSDSSARKKMQQTTEDVIASKLHFSLGRWIELNWSLVEGSRLSHYYKLKGVTYPDDMVDLLLRSFYRKINNQSIDETELIQNYVEKRKKEHDEILKQAETIKVNKRK